MIVFYIYLIVASYLFIDCYRSRPTHAIIEYWITAVVMSLFWPIVLPLMFVLNRGNEH